MAKVVLIAILIATFAIIYNGKLFEYVTIFFDLSKQPSASDKTVQLFTAEQLKLYNGVDKDKLYLSFLGNVFDVTSGAKHYGPGKSYNTFVGRDASRNFIDGKFNIEDISDDVVGLQLNDFKSLDHWLKFYKKQYVKVGFLIGRYYDEHGKLTQYGREIKSLIKDSLKSEETKNELKKKFPPCNVEFDVEWDTGTRVWCTKRSGGIERDFIGYPRKFYEPGAGSQRCACINEENLSMGNIQEYDGCDVAAHSCYIKT